MSKFIYSYYIKKYVDDFRGFILTIDDDFDDFEVSVLDENKKIISNNYYKIKKESLKIIFKIINDNLEVFNLNSYIENSEVSNEEFKFYFECNNLNREIKVFNLFDQNKKEIILLNKVFSLIKEVLFNEKYILEYDNFKIK